MARYEVTHSCGHTQSHQIFGKHSERDRKIAWLETTLCSKCYQADRKEAGPQFLARVVPGFDPIAAAARADRLREEAAEHLQRMECTLRDLPADVQEDVRSGQDRIHRMSGDDQRAREDRQRARDAEERAARLDADAKKPARRAAIELACYANSYEIRGDLKARGWRFSDACPRPTTGDLMQDVRYGTCKGWSWSGSAEEAAAELAWIKSQGWDCTGECKLLTMLRSVIDGRPDLAGLAD